MHTDVATNAAAHGSVRAFKQVRSRLMSLKRNIAANYGSQIYVTLIGIVMVPLYIRYMGAEAFGLVGFFALLQAWFGLLDMGLTPTMARETSRFRGGATDALTYRRFVRSLEGVFAAVALLGGAAMIALSGYIARDWLQVRRLPTSEVETAIRLMALSIGMRWMSGLYRSAVTGSERLVWLSGYNSFIATVRFVAVLAVLKFVGGTPTVFFGFQVGVAALELAGLGVQTYRLMPATSRGPRVPWSLAPLRPTMTFSLTIAFTSCVWVVVTQTDKLVLSKVLPLTEYGYFTLAVLVASGVMMTSGPVSNAIMPRMSRLEAEGDHVGLIRVYRQATQVVAVTAGSVATTVAICAEPLLQTWTGNDALARQAAPIVVLYSLGNGLLAVAAFPFYLQYAKGDLRLHLIGNAVFVIVLIPAIILAATRYGGLGAGYVWLGVNLLPFVTWLPLVHRKFAPGLNAAWYGRDILTILIPAAAAGWLARALVPHGDGKPAQLAEIAAIGIIVTLVAAMASSDLRLTARAWIAQRSRHPEA